MTRTLQVADASGPRPGHDDGVWQAEQLWDRYGASMWALACALLGDETAATRAVRFALADLMRVRTAGTEEETRRRVMRRVHARADELGPVAHDAASGLPEPMVWVSRMARLQRASLALCVYGGLTHREAAVVLEVQPAEVAGMLTSGLRELGRLASDASSCA